MCRPTYSKNFAANSRSGTTRVQYQTHRFYERARGQYVQEQLKLSAREKILFQRENPKSQVMSKTDLAKYRMSWHEHPDIVSKGAQTNFMRFAEDIGAAWEKNPAQFNEHYFKETVALAIMFRAVEKIVSRQPWYKNSYRANIVTYSPAIFHHALSKKISRRRIKFACSVAGAGIPRRVRRVVRKFFGVYGRHKRSRDRKKIRPKNSADKFRR
ncbi:MAG: AIPR family protein [Quinella sp. 1Q7]|nr:AIPR family protein [Quinella sp. 1Q7]